MIYLDNSATTKIHEEVIDAMMPWLRDHYGNASSVYALGREARVAIENSRTEIASYLGAHPAELIFTSGGTESNNLVIRSCAGESGLCKQLASPLTEHHSVLGPLEYLEKLGIRRHKIKVDSGGFVELESAQAINSPEALVCVMHSNNETGVIQPIKEIREIVCDSYLFTDAIQAFGKVELDLPDLGVDFASISAHKIHGPKGIGGLFIRKGIDFKAHQLGGGQERNRRAGTEAIALIVGFCTAARIAVRNIEENRLKMSALQANMREKVLELIPEIRINTPLQRSLPNILNISFKDADEIDGEAILQSLDMAGVAASNGSACVSGSLQPSHVLSAMGLSLEESKAAIRFSMSCDTTQEEIDRAATILCEVIRKLRV